MRNVLVHVAASIALCPAWAGGGILLWRAIVPEPSTPWGGGALGWFVTSLPFGVAVYFAVVGVQHAFYFLEARQRETQAAQLSAQLADARLRALRMRAPPAH